MTLADFAAMPRGHIVKLFYNCSNKGDMIWRQDRVEGDRVYGQFHAPDWPLAQPDGWSEIDGYLYEFDGMICRGSGAEPVFLQEGEADQFHENLE